MNFSIPSGGAVPRLGSQRTTGVVRSAKRGLLAALVVVLALGLCSSSSLAKKKEPQSKSVSGVVLDEADNPIEGATIELADAQSGKVIEIYSQEDGSYHFDGLSFSHDYKIKATFKGSSSEARQISSIDMRPRLVLNLTIPGQKH